MGNSRGSIWKKWDLHIHTPASFHWKGGPQFRSMTDEDKKQSIKKIIEKTESLDIAGFAIMDYWTFEGYLLLKEYCKKENICLTKPIFPGMEIRIECPVDFRLNMHALLSNELTQQTLSEFKHSLKIGTINRSLSDEALIEAARDLNVDQVEKRGYKIEDVKNNENIAWELGSKTAEITKESFFNAIENLPESSLIICPFDTNDGLKKLDWEKHPSAAKIYMEKPHFFETRDQENINLFLDKETSKNKAYINNFQAAIGGKPKPAISGSDAHKIEDYGIFPGEKITWLKTDNTFKGLIQVTIEPKERSFIGKTPNALDHCLNNKSKYIDKIKIGKTQTPDTNENWFDQEIEINPGLVAIIGNKGMGKSALADIIGLLGNSHLVDDFSFLNESKFKDPKNNKSKSFKATITWKTGGKASKCLSESPDLNTAEHVKYIPQKKIEALCNEIPSGEGTEFSQELDRIIFSHIKQPDRLGKDSLPELIDHKTNLIQENIGILKVQLAKTNKTIVSLEEKISPEYKNSLDANIEKLSLEFIAHHQNKPQKEKKPDADPKQSEESKKIEDCLAKFQNSLELVKEVISIKKQEYATLAKKLEATKQIEGKFKNLLIQIENLKEEHSEDLKTLNIKFEDILNVEYKPKVVLEKIKTIEDEKGRLNSFLIKRSNDSLLDIREIIKLKIKRLQSKLDAPNQKYQQYKHKFGLWFDKRKELIGSKETDNTLKYYGGKIIEIKTIPDELEKLRKNRIEISSQIHLKILSMNNIFQELYSSAQHLISHTVSLPKEFSFQFNSSITSSIFLQEFFHFISQGLWGSFYGKKEGVEKLNELIKKTDFNNTQHTIEFLNSVLDHINFDRRNQGKEPNYLKDQLRKDRSAIDFYNFLYSLDYLKPSYSLRLNGKEISKLSPGEKGALLLIFYLLVDKDEIPLIIDQPEENLDNQTVYRLLVPVIKEVKNRRQIIMVTHNPNLAVVCDAEQIIHSALDTKNSNKITYTSGPIESIKINKCIVDVLEGTRPAFENRNLKYFPEKKSI